LHQVNWAITKLRLVN